MNQIEVAKSLRKAEREFGLVETLHQVFGKDIKVSIGFSNKATATCIEDLALSVRSYNALRRSNVKTLGDLIERLNEGAVKNIRNLGNKSYSEIQTKILVYGYERLNDSEKTGFFRKLLENNCTNQSPF